MGTIIIVNDPPYGSERVYNAPRLATTLEKVRPGEGMTVFLMADAVSAAVSGQEVPDGYYNVERMLKRVVAGGGKVLLCGSCMDARGLSEERVMDSARRSTMDELAAETLAAEKVLVF